LLQRKLVDFGADVTFDAAVLKIHEHYGITISAGRVRQVCLDHAKRMASKEIVPCTTLRPDGPECLIAEADGTMLPLVDTSSAPPGSDRRKHRKVSWAEAKVVAVQVNGQVTARYDATLTGDVAEVSARWSRAAGALGWGTKTHIHVVGDGAPWLARQALASFGSSTSYLVDLYHVCDYLTAVWPGEKEVVARHREALKANRTSEVLAAIEGRLEPPEVADEEAPARRALRYLSNRLDQLDYAGALSAGLPIGSGLIESTHRHLLQCRLKRAGAWWTTTNGHAMTQLRVCRANKEWEAYWKN
jgi:hypothetical protein